MDVGQNDYDDVNAAINEVFDSIDNNDDTETDQMDESSTYEGMDGLRKSPAGPRQGRGSVSVNYSNTIAYADAKKQPTR